MKSAAEIVLQDIRCQVYDTTVYTPSEDFLKDSESVVPESLQLFLETILLKHKSHPLEGWKKKCVSIAHAIIFAARSHSILSSIKIGLGTYLYRKFGPNTWSTSAQLWDFPQATMKLCWLRAQL